MQTPRRTLGLVVGVVLGISLLACASAGAAAFPKAPHWLKGPYTKYVLKYDATDSTHTVETTSWPDTNGNDPCGYAISNYDGQGTGEAHIAYDFLFGRSRQGRRLKFAFIWRRAGRSGSLGTTISEHQEFPAGCPEPPPPPPDWPPTLLNETCVSQGPVALVSGSDGFFAGAAARGGKFLVALGLTYKLPESGTCTGNDPNISGINFPEPSPTHFGVSAPEFGRMHFTSRGVKGHKTFIGSVQHNPVIGEETPTGQGTDPESDGNPQRVWNATTTQSGTFVLAPL